MISPEERIANELKHFNNNINVHDLPDIFHYWSNKYLKPMMEEHGISHPDDLYIRGIISDIQECRDQNNYILSIGAGNCDTEVRIAKQLLDKGYKEFTIECLELNPNMISRGKELAKAEGVIDHLIFTEIDFNEWKADKTYISVIANQSLHHIVNLEGVFEQVMICLNPNGSFITNDMIGRNGHQRWPEALEAVHKFWQELPEGYKFNQQLKRLEDPFENWDCSQGCFEGIRAQDILPLLVQNFHFELFISFANIIDVFIDRSFGHNFNHEAEWDKDFIDRVHQFDEESILTGTLKPTHIQAIMKIKPVANPVYSRNLSPEFCVRDPENQ